MQAQNPETTRPSGWALAHKKQFKNQTLGSKPLSVMSCNNAKDFRTVYEAGIELGNVTKEQGEQARMVINEHELFDKQIAHVQTRLSSNSRFVQYLDVSHDLPMRKPEIVVEELKWVLELLGYFYG